MVNVSESLFYLLWVVVIAGPVAFSGFLFGYHHIKPYLPQIGKLMLLWLIIAPLFEKAALDIKAWEFDQTKNLGIIIIQSPIETIIFAILVTLAISFPVLVWTHYEDIGKPIIKTSIHDVIHGTYAFWKKSSKRTRH